MVVHQLLPSFRAGDATGQAALHFQLLLRRLGVWGEIFADEVSGEIASLARPASSLKPREGDWVLYHHGIASPLASRMLHLRCRRGLIFHNVSPRRFYRGTALEEVLVAARAQLAALVPHMDLSIGVSEYNAAELREAGAKNVQVVPLFIEPERFALDQADPTLLSRLRRHEGEGPTLVTVSRLVPHKRMEDAVSLMAELRRIRPNARLVVVGGYESGSKSFKALHERARSVGGIEFLGNVSHAELVAAYHSAQLFVSMSEHEGFGVPLLEAMASGLPVMAYGAAAVPETLGGAGVAFTEKRYAFLAELATELCEDASLRERILRGQQQRLEELSAERAGQALARALEIDGGRTESAIDASHPVSAIEARRTGSAFDARRTESAIDGSRTESRIDSDRPGIATTGAEREGTKKRRLSRPHVAFVVQRFGDVDGGAEKHAKDVATRLTKDWDVTVLTTCARDHLTWDNSFSAGRDTVDGLPVERFPVIRGRDIHRFNALSKKVFDRPLERVREEHWVAEQGPLSPALLRHLSEPNPYDGFVFFTYLYAPTVWGLPLVSRRALLVPTAHDESPIRFGVYRDVFERPRALLCNTPEEMALIDRLFPSHARARVVGVGVDAKKGVAARFREQHGIRDEYLMYVGRLEAGKGLPELLSFHRKLVRDFEDAPWLLLAGAGDYQEKSERVRYLGRISEEEKEDGIAGALGVVVPSRYESLSLLTLEAFAQATPVLVNAASDVLAGQVARSGAGVSYSSAESFASGVRALGLNRETWGRNGRKYARSYTWPRVLEIYREEMDRILKETRR